MRRLSAALPSFVSTIHVDNTAPELPRVPVVAVLLLKHGELHQELPQAKLSLVEHLNLASVPHPKLTAPHSHDSDC